MRNLLQDKRAVTVLALVALLAVGWRVQDSWRHWFPAAAASARQRPLGAGPAMVDSPSSSQAVSGALDPSSPTPPSVLANLTSWDSMFPIGSLDRDPFGPPPAVQEPDPPTPVPLPTDVAFALQAISLEPHQAFAVINRQVLAVGETVGEFVVERITATEVWLKHPGGRKVLPLEFAQPDPVEVPDRTGSTDNAHRPPGS